MKMKLDQSVAPSFTTEELVFHHDVVFRAPVCDSTYGIPIGDGDTGCLLWLSEDTLHVQINDTALIDDIRGDTDYCSAPDETMTYCRNGAQWNLHFGCPVFETIYQDSFEARLPLAEAVILLATAPKSNTACMAIDAALADVRAGRTGSIPRELQNVHADSAGQERAQGYQYPHSFPRHWVEQQYLPDELVGTCYYQYGDNKTEQAAKRYWEEIKGR